MIIPLEKDYTKYSFAITLLVIIILSGISFIPSFTMGGVRIKRANIFSDIYEFGDEKNLDAEARLNPADKAFLEDLKESDILEGLSIEDTLSRNVLVESWDLNVNDKGHEPQNEKSENPNIRIAETISNDSAFQYINVVEIEDFSDGNGPSIRDFCSLLGTASASRVVRLGFLGDSYIEGDIITADIREQLQIQYGGGGVGFVPFSTPLAQNRPTVKHTYGGWKNYNLMQKRSAPDNIKDIFYVSGSVSVPSEGAWSIYESVSFRKKLKDFNRVRLLFTNTLESEITMTVNDTIERTFIPDQNESIQQINISGNNIEKIKISVANPDGFYGYGVIFESGNGISVDNYSIRSNSGLALFGTSSSVNSRMNNILGYDMIVLQYGLNAMESEITNYKSYGDQLRKMINYIKACFPGSIIVVMGVGDRSTLKNGEFVSMPAVKAMAAEQRSAAMDCNVAFWNTYEAMGGHNSMSRFVDKGWAAKDYTHLSFGGGRKIATEFVNALEYAKISSGQSHQPNEGETININRTPSVIGERPETLESFSTTPSIESDTLHNPFSYPNDEEQDIEVDQIIDVGTEGEGSVDSLPQPQINLLEIVPITDGELENVEEQLDEIDEYIIDPSPQIIESEIESESGEEDFFN